MVDGLRLPKATRVIRQCRISYGTERKDCQKSVTGANLGYMGVPSTVEQKEGHPHIVLRVGQSRASG